MSVEHDALVEAWKTQRAEWLEGMDRPTIAVARSWFTAGWVDRAKWQESRPVTDEQALVEDDVLEHQRRALEVAIGYSPVRVSIQGHPGIGYTHRTAEDRDDLVTRILDAGFRLTASGLSND